MDRFVPLDKKSKKEQKKFHAKQRKTWGEFSPVTRTVPNGKAYNRKKLKTVSDEAAAISEILEKLLFCYFWLIRTFDTFRTTPYDGGKGGACHVQEEKRPILSGIISRGKALSAAHHGLVQK